MSPFDEMIAAWCPPTGEDCPRFAPIEITPEVVARFAAMRAGEVYGPHPLGSLEELASRPMPWTYALDRSGK